MKAHPAANLFPMMGEEDLSDLARDIREHGLRHPIVVYDGKILDGRNRYEACRRAGVEPELVQWLPSGTPTAYVLSCNLARRHLSVAQRAIVAAEAEPAIAAARASKHAQGRSRDAAAALTGVSPRYVSEAKALLRDAPDVARLAGEGALNLQQAKKVARMCADERDQVRRLLSDGTNPKAAVREIERARKAALADAIRRSPPSIPAEQYRVIAADPPWPYEQRIETTTGAVRGLCDYPAMSVDDIAALPARQLSYDDATLWLWTTNAFMHEAFHVAAAWGFAQKTILTWDKGRIGTGRYLRNQTEHCLVCVRGRPVLSLSNQSTLLREPPREASRKPASFYRLLDEVCVGPKLEMFAREQRDGWDAWGAETTKLS